MIKINCEILKIMRKTSKEGKPYNQVLLGLPGYEKASFFLPERLVPDCIEGKKFDVEFSLTFKNWKPDLRIIGIAKEY